MFWLILAICSSIAFIQIIRWVQHDNGDLAFVGWVNYLFAALFFFVPFILEHASVIAWPVFCLGLISGTIYVLNFFLLSVLIRLIGIGLVSATASLAVIVPVVVSIALGDPWLDKAAGLLMTLIALPMVAMARTQLGTKPSASGIKRWIGVLVFFTAVGAENTSIKLAREVGGQGFETFFLPALFVAAAILATVALLVRRSNPSPRGVACGLILGTCNIISNYGMALAVQTLTGPVVFPVKLIGVVLGTTILGRLLWRERLNWIGLIGIGLCIISTALLAMPEVVAW